MRITVEFESSEALYAVHDIAKGQMRAREQLAFCRSTDADPDTIDAIEYAIDRRQDAIDKLDAALNPDRPRRDLVGARTLRELAAEFTAETLR